MAAAKHNYLYLLTPGPAFSDNLSPEQEKVLAAHFDRLQAATRTGEVLIAGPCTDRAFGIVVFHARTEAEAQEFMDSDPAVKDGLMEAELHPFRVSLLAEGVGRRE